MLIATDIGNSSVTIGYFTSRGLLVQRIPTIPLKSPEEYRQRLHAFIKEKNVEKGEGASIISSVVSNHTRTLIKAIEGLPGQTEGSTLVVDHRLAGIRFRIDRPEELGTDRIANAVAAYALLRKPVVVIDFGTATTITVIDGNGDYLGGAIMPGIGLMNEALAMKTSKLRKVEVVKPETALGRDTAGCILSGLIIGTSGAVERIVAEIENETGTLYDVILTGGNCLLVDTFMRKPHMVRPDLTLEGLKILYEKNRP